MNFLLAQVHSKPAEMTASRALRYCFLSQWLLFTFLTVEISSRLEAFGQGLLELSNRNIPHPEGGGTTYNIPIWHQTAGDGAGDLPGGVRASLFRPSDLNFALATSILRTTTFSEFFASPTVQTVIFHDLPPGATPQLVFRVWQGTARTFEQAVADGLAFREVHFTSLPLGGTQGSEAVPGMNFSLDSSGVIMIPEPSIIPLCPVGFGALVLRGARCLNRRDYYYSDATLTFPRWGDYSAVSLDPNDSETFWTFQQYAETDGEGLQSSYWGNWTASLKLGP